jgi:hypothetical protein
MVEERPVPSVNPMTPEQKHASGARCLSVSATAIDAIHWKFDDGTEITTKQNLSTVEGRLEFGKLALRLEFESPGDLLKTDTPGETLGLRAMGLIQEHGPGVLLDRDMDAGPDDLDDA